MAAAAHEIACRQRGRSVAPIDGRLGAGLQGRPLRTPNPNCSAPSHGPTHAPAGSAKTKDSAGAREVLTTTKPAPKGTGFGEMVGSELLKEAHLGPKVQVSSGGSPGAPQAVQTECRQLRRALGVRSDGPLTSGRRLLEQGPSVSSLLVADSVVCRSNPPPRSMDPASGEPRPRAIGVHTHCAQAHSD